MIRFWGYTSDNKPVEYTQLIKTATWSGGYDKGCRKLEFSVLNSIYDKSVGNINISVGATVVITDNDNEIFRGVVIERDLSSNDNTITYYALDRGNYILRNEWLGNYQNKTAEEITQEVCKEFNLEVGDLAKTDIKMDKLFVAKTLYEIIMTAYSEASKKTGKKYMVLFHENRLNVIEKGIATIPVKLAEGININESSYNESIANMVTRVRIFKDNNRIDTVINEDDEKRFGTHSKVMTFDTTSSGTNGDAGDNSSSIIGGAISETDLRKVCDKYVGLPYIWGGGHCNPPTGQRGYDCSGFCSVVLYDLGLKNIGTTAAFLKLSPVVPWDKEKIQPGDCLVRYNGGSGHVVMVINKTTIAEAPKPGLKIRYTNIDWQWNNIKKNGGKIVRPLANSSLKR